MREVDRGRVGGLDHEVRVAEVDRLGPHGGGAEGAEQARPAGRRPPTPGRARAGPRSTSAMLTAVPSPGLDRHAADAGVGRDGHRAGAVAPPAEHGLRQAADAVAAHLGSAPIGVAQHHHHIGCLGVLTADGGAPADEPVGADAAVPIAQPARQVGRTRRPGPTRRGSRCRVRGACSAACSHPGAAPPNPMIRRESSRSRRRAAQLAPLASQRPVFQESGADHHGIVLGDTEFVDRLPADAGVATEPALLASGEAAGAPDGGVDGLVEAASSRPDVRAAPGSRGPGGP